MQLVFDFSQWLISPRQGVVGRQYDNLSHSLVVEGELPSGYTWDMLVEAKGKYNIIPLSATATGATASLTADQLAFGDTYYAFQLRGTSGEIIHHTNAVQVYVPDTIVGPGTWPVLPTEFSQAEANIKELNAHPPVPGENGYWMLWDLDTHSYVQSQLVVPGLHIEIGETTTGEPGTPANVTNSGTNTAPVLNFTIPEGEKGDAATIQVGTVTASEPGSEPQVKNSGTENAAVFDFVLPRGQTGPTGPAATIEVENTVTGEPGTQASVENVGTTGAAKLRFTIPRGNTGQDGVTPTLSAGDVETLEPDQTATASVTGAGPEYQINLGIPRGQTGAQGTPGQNGEDGQTPTISVGTVTTLDPGQDATAEITGETPNLVLSLGIPQGQPGKDGPANTLQIGTVETLEPGQTATAQITGEAPNQTLSLGIPQGQTGKTGATPALEIGQVETLEPGEPATAELSGTPEAPVLSLGIPQGPPGQDGVQLNDDAINTTEAWSSKKIVDTLCPSFSVSGNPVICHPVEDYPLSAVVTLEPKQAGTGDPSPDNVRAISGWDSVTVTQSKDEAQVKQITLTLPETIYGGTVDAVTGVGEKAWECIEFDGTEKYLGLSTSDGFQISYLLTAIANIDERETGVCSHFKYAVAKAGCFWVDSSGGFVRFLPNEISSVESWKSYLAAQASAGTPVQVAYKLATPEPFQATGNQALPAVAGLNTVHTDGDSLDVTGRQDLLYTLQNMQAQTQNLNRFIAEGGTQ